MKGLTMPSLFLVILFLVFGNVATEVGDLSGKGCPYGLIGTAYQSFGQLEIKAQLNITSYIFVDC